MNRSPVRATVAIGLTLLFCFPRLSADKDKDLKKHYGLIFGTAYGPDDRSVYGAKIQIHPVATKHPNWEPFSDHRGEFALRVAPGPNDYLISGEVEFTPVVANGAPQTKRKLRAETKVHIQAEERQDVSLHFK